MSEELLILPTKDEERVIRKAINQDEDKLQHILKLFLNWLSYQQHLPQKISENLIRNYISACKLDLEKTKRKFENFCYASIMYEELVSNRSVSPDGDLKCLEYVQIVPLPKLTPEGYRISVIKVLDGEELQILPILRYSLMIIEYRVFHDVVLAGEVFIFDMEFIKPSHYTKIFNQVLLRFIKLVIGSYSTLINKIILMACHPILQKGVNLCKTVLPQKVANRILTINSLQELHQHIPAQCLPSNYEGTQKSLEELTNKWRNHLMKSSEFYDELNKIKPNGPIPKHLVSYGGNEYGADGSFRQLNID